MLRKVCWVIGGRVGEKVVVDESGDTVFALHCANLPFALRLCSLSIQVKLFDRLRMTRCVEFEADATSVASCSRSLRYVALPRSGKQVICLPTSVRVTCNLNCAMRWQVEVGSSVVRRVVHSGIVVECHYQCRRKDNLSRMRRY